ncbi:g157 [Coccomyxa viridis]|uniref:Mitochondrial import inner membrane translocase subunit n=1 Tax=Coccomyxa viridis TaxID=1274662 RepID=A0ABP1FLK1_9CHLO
MSASEEEKMSPELQQFLMAEQAKAQMQQTVARLTDTCWDKCIGTPGRSLSSREESCLSECAKRFIETTQFVVQRFRSKASGADSGF